MSILADTLASLFRASVAALGTIIESPVPVERWLANESACAVVTLRIGSRITALHAAMFAPAPSCVDVLAIARALVDDGTELTRLTTSVYHEHEVFYVRMQAAMAVSLNARIFIAQIVPSTASATPPPQFRALVNAE